MKRFVLFIVLSLFLCGCGKSKVINGVEYHTYGWLNKEENKDPNTQYRLVGENIFWIIIFSETIVIPLLITGLDLYEPVQPIVYTNK